MESPDAATSPRPRLLRWLRAELVYGLELAALVALALTQPVLDLFGRAPDVFVFEGADGGDVITFAILFSVVPLGLLWALEAGVGVLHGRVRRALHLGLVAVAAALVTVNAVKQLSSVRGPTAVVLASAGALAAGLAYTRTRVVKQFLQVAGAALPLFVALFLLVSPVGALVRPGGGATFDGAQVEETPPVVMLMLDELPLASLLRSDGSIDAELYPNFARLAGIANWYPNATTVSSATWYAVPSLLSGRLPEEDALPLVTDWPDNLFTVLSDDYGLEVQEALTGLCPLSRCSRTGSGGGLRAMARRGLRVFADVVSPEDSEADPTATFVEPRADDQPDIDFDAFERFQPDRFNRFVHRIGTAPEPAVHYLHLLLPHTPWRLFPSGREYANPEHLPGNDEGVWAQDGWASLQARQRHLLQTRYVDGLVGELLDRLEATGLLEPSMLIVTSDHGIAFQPGQPLKGNKREDLPPAIAPEMAWVPLFVKTPGQGAGETDDRNALLVDVLPTVADVLGVDLPSSVDGRSLLGPPRRERTKPYFHAYDSTYFGVNAGKRNEIPIGRRDELAALGVDAFGPETDPDLRLHSIGPRPDLVGRPVEDLGSGSAADVEAQVAEDPFRASTPDAGPLPAFVDGTLSGDPGDDAAVAIAVNGVIGAVSPVFAHAGAPHAFAGLLPEARFASGSDDLELYLVSTRVGDLRARPLAQRGP